MSVYFGYILGSAVLDIIANVMLEMSNGFKHKRWGIAAVVFIMAAFGLCGLGCGFHYWYGDCYPNSI